MSNLQAIEEAIEKVAFAPGLGAALGKAAQSPGAWKAVGKRALIGAGVGAVGNVALGDSNQSIMERATKGAIGGGAVGGLYGAGRVAYKTNAALGRVAKAKGIRAAQASPPVAKSPYTGV